MARSTATGHRPGGFVTIKGRVGDRIVSRRVSIKPAFDPDAISMTPIKGWTAGRGRFSLDHLEEAA